MTTDFVLTRLIDLVIAFTLIELAALALHRRVTGRGLALDDFAANMVSGLCLMLALRGLSSGAGVAWVAPCLLAAGLAHGVDIARRLRRKTSNRRQAQ